MVDASERMIIVYDGEAWTHAGTKDALLYARSSGVEVRPDPMDAFIRKRKI